MSLPSLLALGEELRAVFAAERAAIAALDHARLEELTAQKRAIVEQLAGLGEITAEPAAKALFAAIRVEAQATALLAAAASEAVRALLGYSATGGYDRRARQTTAGPGRVLAAL
jgi:hypothetical protein